METRITRRKMVLLEALMSGPGYGKELVERVTASTGERAAVAKGYAYAALRALERTGLVHGYDAPVPKLRGRLVRHYAVTESGAAVVASGAAALARAS